MGYKPEPLILPIHASIETPGSTRIIFSRTRFSQRESLSPEDIQHLPHQWQLPEGRSLYLLHVNLHSNEVVMDNKCFIMWGKIPGCEEVK